MANAGQSTFSKLVNQSDVFLAGGVIAILMVMLIPMPTIVLDLMLSVSISLSILILITAMFMTAPLDFSIFPSLLLVTTLLRLSLNVAATRLILMNGDKGTQAAGSVIESFGQFVVGGSYIIGAVIFLILFILNKVVITTGTTRIAEVAARFNLDAMPGKQMAIEADLNSGLIDEQEATSRRNTIRREADFYGAMDGAGKFVQGDVNAGMFITLVNIVGGILIGVLQKGMDWQTAMQTYSLLTIGDGLVATIPSIITSTACGMIVSRAASESRMGEEYFTQLTSNSRALSLVSGVLLVFALVPGMPTLPFIILSAIMFGLSRLSKAMYGEEGAPSSKSPQSAKRAQGGQVGQGGQAALGGAGAPGAEGPEGGLGSPEEVQALLPLDTLELEVGYGLVPLVDESQNGNLLMRIRSIRRQFALEMGVVLPSLHLRDNLQLKPGQYALLIKGNEVAGAEILIDHFLAMDPGNIRQPIKGIETREPAFNLPALWIPEAQKDEAMLCGYTVVDPASVIATHLTEVFRRHLADFIGRQETQALLDNLAKTAPKVVEELVPTVLSLGTVQKVLQLLVRENVSIRDLLTIVETLADYGYGVKSPEMLAEHVREKLSRTIVKPYLDSQGSLPIITFDPAAEQMIQDAIKQTEQGVFLALTPGVAQKMMQQINTAVENAVNTDGQPVVLVTPQVRPHLAQLITRFLPTIPVISQAEIPGDIRLNSAGVVRIE